MAGCGIRVKMEARCGMTDGYFNGGIPGGSTFAGVGFGRRYAGYYKIYDGMRENRKSHVAAVTRRIRIGINILIEAG